MASAAVKQTEDIEEEGCIDKIEQLAAGKQSKAGEEEHSKDTYKVIKEIEKIPPTGVEEDGLPKAAYYVIHYEDGTEEEADFIVTHEGEDSVISDEQFVPMSKEEVLAHLDSALHDLKLNLEGKLKFQPIENLFTELACEDEEDEEEAKAIAK